MTDRELQDVLDRASRSTDADLDTDDPDVRAYRAVFSALEEPPEGDLSPDFAERVADRVGLTAERAPAWYAHPALQEWGWAAAALVLLLTGALLWMPGAFSALGTAVLAPLAAAGADILAPLAGLAAALRLDVLTALAVAAITAPWLDRALHRLLAQRTRVPAS